MKLSRKILVACGITCILGAQVYFIVSLSTPNGIRIRSPERDSTVGRELQVSGDAWMKAGIAKIEVVATLGDNPAGKEVVATATRDAVRYRGDILYLLSSWSAHLELPSDGEWHLSAVASSPSGETVNSSLRAVRVRFGARSQVFKNWSPAHLIPLALILLLSVGLGFLARVGRESEYRPTRSFDRVALGITLVVWTNELVYQIYWYSVDGWSVALALMLQMCGLSILLFPIAFFSESKRTRQWLFDVLYFWGIGGAIQALIAPDIGSNGFPDYRYFSFFISHGLIIASGIVLAMAGGVRITLRSLLRAVIVTNLLLIPIYGIDWAISLIPPYDPGDYFVLAYPPPSGSIVDLFSDLFGPSPRYVVGLEAMGLAVFAVLYAPWPIARLFRQGNLSRRTRPAA